MRVADVRAPRDACAPRDKCATRDARNPGKYVWPIDSSIGVHAPMDVRALVH